MAIFIYFLLVLIIPHEADSISFEMRNNSFMRDIVVMGDASLSIKGMELIPDSVPFTAGRGIYDRMLHIWDKTTRDRELTSFSTNFSFVIESSLDPYKYNVYMDGLAFFLADNNSVAVLGASLGLPVIANAQLLNSFVAVEFDTYWNSEWDPADLSPNDYHAGINVNSLSSSMSKKWSINITQGAQCQASVTYDSVSKNHSVSVTDDVYGCWGKSY